MGYTGYWVHGTQDIASWHPGEQTMLSSQLCTMQFWIMSLQWSFGNIKAGHGIWDTQDTLDIKFTWLKILPLGIWGTKQCAAVNWACSFWVTSMQFWIKSLRKSFSKIRAALDLGHWVHGFWVIPPLGIQGNKNMQFWVNSFQKSFGKIVRVLFRKLPPGIRVHPLLSNQMCMQCWVNLMQAPFGNIIPVWPLIALGQSGARFHSG